MRLSYLAQDRVDLAEAPRQKMSEPREFDFVPPKRAARRLVGKPKAAIRCRSREHVDKITVSALSVGEAEFYAVVKRRQVGPSLRSIYMFRGIPMKVEIQSDSSTATSMTDRLRAGPRTQHIDTRFFLGTRRSARRRSQYQEIPTAKIVQMLERSQSLLQYFCSIAHLLDWYFTDFGSNIHRMMGYQSDLVVNIEPGAKLSEVTGTGEELSTWHNEWSMTGEKKEEEDEEEEEEGEAMCNE